MSSQSFDPDLYTKMMCLTSTYHCTVYPALQSAQGSAAGKYILITGASKGLGSHMAKAWAAGGAAGIAICARSASGLESVAAELKSINSSVEVLVRVTDTTKPSEVEALFIAAKEKFGKLDVVIANVGVADEPLPIGTQDPNMWWDAVTANVRSSQLAAHYFIKLFGPIGTFITMASGAAALVVPGLSAYGMSKQACIRLAEFLDAEYPELKVFSMDPGIVKGVASLEAFVPFAVVEPEVVGAFSVWLASGKAEGCRGGYVHVAWDVVELEERGDEIKEKGLVKTKFLGGVLGQEGGAFGK
jgi:NAD(P)-dependent dehydrogenase (short-subunit alcohol dehydrogenase family)